MRGLNPLLLSRVLRNQSQRQPMDFGEVVSLASEQNFLDERARQAQSLDRQFGGPVYGGSVAPLVGLLRGLSKASQQRTGDARLSELFDAVQAERAGIRAAEVARASQAAEAERQRQLEDEARQNQEWRARRQFEQQFKEAPDETARQLNEELLEARQLANQKSRRELDAPPPQTEPSFEEKEDIKRVAARRAALAESATTRSANIAKAQKFLEAFEDGAASGKWRSAMSIFPTFTEQGEFDEEFSAFAETAARAALKANGETRPTDADVEGMKQSMFGVGRDADVNKTLLKDFLDNMAAEENEYRRLTGREPLRGNSVPSGIEPRLWEALTDEERALWNN